MAAIQEWASLYTLIFKRINEKYGKGAFEKYWEHIEKSCYEEKKVDFKNVSIDDFIIIYNETFKYLECKYGETAVRELWATISEEWCTHLDALVRTKGLDGMLEYWGGDNGTLGREKAEYEVGLQDGVFTIIMHQCPSVGELVTRGREIYHGKLNYCQHCLALYRPVAIKYGYEMTMDVDYDAVGGCTGRCRLKAYSK